MNATRTVSHDQSTPWMIYGANGYTGELIAREAHWRGYSPILAGRNSAEVQRVADELSLPFRVFDLENRVEIEKNIRDVRLVLHCAGPFIHTARPMYQSCLETSVHYLDITGEILVLENLYALDAAARERGVVLMPGVGFDVVPTDCLALSIKERLPSATRLRIILSTGTTRSRGTLKSTIESITRGGIRRRNGILEPEPLASSIRRFSLDGSGHWMVRIPWGDLSSAFRTTGIPDIEVYFTTSLPLLILLQLLRPFAPLLRIDRFKRCVLRRIDRTARGPDLRSRETGTTVIRAEAYDPEGRTAGCTITTPEPYKLTAMVAVECASRVAAGGIHAGSVTPAKAFGSDFIHRFVGVLDANDLSFPHFY